MSTTGELDTGNVRIKVKDGGIANMDFLLAVRLGVISGYSIIHKFGHTDAVSTTIVPIASGNVYQTVTTPQTLELVSSDTTDNQAGVGARTVVIEGLDANFNIQIVTANMHATVGTTAEEVTGYTWVRVYRMYVENSGSYASSVTGSHAGTITLRTSGGAGVNWAILELHGGFPLGQSEIGSYTVPAGKTAYVGHVEVETDSSKAVDILFFKRESANTVSAPFSSMRTQAAFTGITDNQELAAKTWMGPFPEYTDIGFMAVRSSAGTSAVSVDFEILLRDN